MKSGVPDVQARNIQASGLKILPENLTGLNVQSHSGLSNFILYFFRATSGASCMGSGNQRHHHHAILSVLTLAFMLC